jgi:hypothetical protein
MNPSAQDIAMSVNKVNAKNVFIFPNNKNIILASEQAKSLTNKKLHVVPSKSFPEGVSAILSFNEETSIEENLNAMQISMANVVTGSVTYAVRDTVLDGFTLKQGDIIGLNYKEILSKGDSLNLVVENLIERLINDEHININLFYGQDVNEKDANQLLERLQKKYPDHEVNLYFGGQSVYYYILSLD